MPKRARPLSALAVRRLGPGFHPVGGVAGLALVVRSTGAKSWVLRVAVGGKRRDIGLGAYPEVTLAKAHERAAHARDLIRQGIDPVRERKAQRDALRAQTGRARTFRQCTDAYLKRKTAEFSNPRHAAQWRTTIEQYAYPVVGDLPVEAIQLGHITRILEPVWTTKTETATRVRQRIEAVLAYAITHGYRTGANVAVWKGNLDTILPNPQKLKRVKHFAAVPVGDMADFWARLGSQDGTGAQALQFLILTAARSGEVRGARWDEIDLQGQIWTVSASRMKARREHVVPLCPAAVEVLEARPRESALIFPAPRGGVLSDMALSAVLRRMGVDATVHGFRSVFRTWSAEHTGYPREVLEQALAHTLGALEQAYNRSTLLEKRRRLMGDWQRFLETPAMAGQVRALRA